MRKEFVVSLVVMLAAALAFVACGGSGGGGGGNGGGGGIHTIALVNGQAADVVIGQPDFTSGNQNQGGAASQYTLSTPLGNPAFAGGRLYIPDWQNNRVLGYNSIPAVNNAPADFVLGQSDFTTTAFGTTQSTLDNPADVASDGGKLFVLDTENNRVLIYNSLPSVTGALPDVVVGQTDFTSVTNDCTDSNFDYPMGMYAVAGKLIVSDLNNSRVLIWNTIPAINNAPADIVLGQADFTSCLFNRGGSVAQNSLNEPIGVWSDGKKLMVADHSNHRVLIWNAFPTASDTPPDVVLGQADFTSAGSDTTQDSLYFPAELTSNGKQLFLTEWGNKRVVVWNTIPTTNGAPADRVLGQPDFTTNSAGLSASAMDDPQGILVHDNQLIVIDGQNSRALIFNGQ